MSIIAPNPIATLPTPPVKGQAGFNTAAETYFNALVNPFTPQLNAAIAATNANALDAQSSAVSAQLSAATANARQWASGSYATGAAVWSPASLAAGVPSVYVRKAPGGASPTDPQNDLTNWVKYVPSNTTGGAVYTTSTTLTSSSPFAISISGGSGVWLKLPDATILPAGIRHVVRNTGDNDLTVLDSTGAVIGFIRPQCGTTIALSDSSTAAGKWVGDFEQIGVTADFQFGASVAGLQNVKQIIQLDAVRTMVITGGSNGQGLWAVVYDTATQTAGAPVMIRSAAYGAMGIKTSSNKVLVVSWDGSSQSMASVMLTADGTSVSIGTAATASITGAFTSTGNMVVVGGAVCVSYLTNAIACVRAITISDTTTSIGEEKIGNSTNASRLYSVEGYLLSVRISTTSSINAMPYSLSGNTLTEGTGVTIATTMIDGFLRTMQYPSGGVLAIHANGGNYVASIISLSGAVASANTATIRSHGTLASGSIFGYNFDHAIIDSSKVLFSCAVNSDFSIFSANIITNNNGTPTVGTPLDFNHSSGSLYIAEVKSSNAGECGFILTSNTITQTMFFNCAGVSPIRSRVHLLANRIGGPAITGNTKTNMGATSGAICANSRATYAFGNYINSGGYTTPIYSVGASGAQVSMKTPIILRAAASIRGENDQTTYSVTSLNSTAESSLGVALQRIQIAQV